MSFAPILPLAFGHADNSVSTPYWRSNNIFSPNTTRSTLPLSV